MGYLPQDLFNQGNTVLNGQKKGKQLSNNGKNMAFTLTARFSPVTEI